MLFTSRLTLADAGQCSTRKKLITGKLFYNQVVKHLFRNSENASARSDKQRQLTGIYKKVCLKHRLCFFQVSVSSKGKQSVLCIFTCLSADLLVAVGCGCVRIEFLNYGKCVFRPMNDTSKNQKANNV